MIKVVVFHADVSRVMEQDPELVGRLLLAPDESDVEDVVAMAGYERVAELDVACATSIEALEKAFVMTQNLTDPWCQSPGVNALVKEARSTMIGDVFVIDGKSHVVAMVGFRPVKPLP